MSIGKLDLVGTTPVGPIPLAQVAMRLNPVDDVAVARSALLPGTVLQYEQDSAPAQATVRQFVASGHKIALRAVTVGQPVRRYGQIIGFATREIAAGEHVHTHNLAVQDFGRDYDFCAEARPVALLPEAEHRAFLGFRRADGRVGTRNYIAVLASVNCSAHTVRQIAAHFTPERLAAYPNVDGVIALAHAYGCGSQLGGADYVLLQRTLAGMACHANVAAYVIVGLGCEINQVADLVTSYGLESGAQALNIQSSGGIRKTVQAGIEAVNALLPLANTVQRTPQPVSELMVALQCGGSDGWSGVTANPALGLMVDALVRQGGTAALAETPEIYGAEHLLTRRAIRPEVGQKLVDKVRWWEKHTQRLGIEIDNNPSVGNKAGGLTTIYEKSLGAIAKGGSTPLMAVYDYAERITERGFVYIDTPGYDPVAVTGQVAGGCTLVLFTTGRGSVFGYKPAPSIKISTNTQTYNHMPDDMDLDAGRILDGVPMQTVADELFDLMIAVASGQQSKSEAQGVGESEFNPWHQGGTL